MEVMVQVTNVPAVVNSVIDTHKDKGENDEED